MSTDFNNLETSPRYRVSQPPFGLVWEWLRVITEKTCIGVKMPFWPRRGCVELGRLHPVPVTLSQASLCPFPFTLPSTT